MNGRLFLGFLFALTVRFQVAAWDMGAPVVFYWSGPGFPEKPMTEESIKQIKEAGFNTVWGATRQDLDIAQKYGMRVIYNNNHYDIRNEFSLDAPWLLLKLEKAMDAVKDHPALYLYFVTDEPPVSYFERWGRHVAKMRQYDPKHPAYINLLPTYGMTGEVYRAYSEYLRCFIETVHPQLISYDNYQFMKNGDRGDYFLNLAMVSESARAQGIPFFNVVQACNWVPGSKAMDTPRVPNPDELRYLVYTSAAYGARGISYYVYSWPEHEGPIVALDGTPSPNYYALKTLNREFYNIVCELQALKFVGAYHNGRQAVGATPYCSNAVLSLSPSAPAVPLKNLEYSAGTTLVSRFDKPDTETLSGSCFLVVNLDYKTNRTVTVSAPMPMERFDALGAKWYAADGKSCKLDLLPGGGNLLRLK